jgi:hypothetical protein
VSCKKASIRKLICLGFGFVLTLLVVVASLSNTDALRTTRNGSLALASHGEYLIKLNGDAANRAQSSRECWQSQWNTCD